MRLQKSVSGKDWMTCWHSGRVPGLQLAWVSTQERRDGYDEAEDVLQTGCALGDPVTRGRTEPREGSKVRQSGGRAERRRPDA